MELLACIEDNDIGGVETMLRSGAPIDGLPSGIPPLILASARGFFSLVKFLVARGANVDIQSTQVGPCQKGDRPLYVASFFTRIEIMRYLMDKGADAKMLRDDGRTPLHAACCGEGEPRNLVRAVRLLLGAGADPAAACFTHGYTPFHAAAYGGKVEVMRELVSRFPELKNVQDMDGKTPLCVSASEGHAAVVEYLMGVGACKVMDSASEYSTLLALATLRGHEEVVRLLLGAVTIEPPGPGEKNVTCLAQSCAVLFKRPRILEVLLDAGAQSDNPEFYFWDAGMSMLHAAAGFGDALCSHVLLARGAREDRVDVSGKLPHEVIGKIDKASYTVEFKHGGVYGLDRLRIAVSPGGELALRRMLARGPAYRANSWGWPSAPGEADARDGPARPRRARPSASTTPPRVRFFGSGCRRGALFGALER